MPRPQPGTSQRFPTGSEYATALQNTNLCFQHSDLRGAEPAVTGLGLPKAISGNFASVFELKAAGGRDRYAVKCFTRHIPDQNDRYRLISGHLTSLPKSGLSQPWNMGFDYLDDEILVEGKRYPVLKMEWLQGQGLAAWLDHHHRESAQVEQLAERFEALLEDLYTHGIAHGDLQHGNLLVAPDLSFRLVDYDGMYVPALAGQRGTEDGHRNYQSPLRSGNFGPDIDRFSGWIIHTALRAVAADPRLWADLHEPSGEYLLLAEDDYQAPTASPRFARLLSHPTPEVAQSARKIADLLTTPMNAIPRLQTPVHGHRTDPRGNASQTSAAKSRTGLPNWLHDHIPAQASSPDSRSESHDVGFHYRRRMLDLVVLPLSLASFAVLPLVVLGVLSLGIIVAVTLGAGGAVMLDTARRSRPECRELAQRVRELKKRGWEARHPEAATEQLARERDTFEEGERKRAADADQKGRQLTHDHQKRLAKVESDTQKKERGLRARLMRLDDDLTIDLRKRLEEHKKRYVELQLRQDLIARAKIPGIGSALKDALRAAGVRTAADFQGITLLRTGGHYNSVTAYITLNNGLRVDVKGIGPTKAQALERWRNQQLLGAQTRCATVTLPSDEMRAAKADFQRRRTELRDRLRDAAAEGDSAREKAADHLRQAREQLRRRADRERTAARGQREAFAQRSLQLQQATAAIPALDAALTGARRNRRGLSTLSYLRFLLTSRPTSPPRP